MTKRNSQMAAEFKPPQRTQRRVKRHKSTGEETDLQPVDINQTLKLGNDNSQYASRSEQQTDCQTGPSNETAEFLVAPCALEEKTSQNDKDEHDTSPEVQNEMEKTALIAVETPELNNNDKCTLSEPLNLEVSNFGQPDIELDDKESETTTNNSTQEYLTPQVAQSVLGHLKLSLDDYQTGREMLHEMNVESTATEEKMGGLSGCSESVAEALAEVGSEVPPIKRRARRRMGMCWPGERKRKQKGQHIRGKMIGEGKGNVAGTSVLGVEESLVMTSDSLKKDIPVSLEKVGTAEPELSGSSFPTSCPLQDIPLNEEQVDFGNDIKDHLIVEYVLSNPKTVETANASPDIDAPSLLETKDKVEMFSVEDNGEESNITEEKTLLAPEMSSDPAVDAMEPSDVTTEIGTEVSEVFTDNCKGSNDVSAEDADLMQASPDVLKDDTKASPSTFEVDKNVEEPLEGVFNEMEVEESGRQECKTNPSTMFASAHDEVGGLEHLRLFSEDGAEESNLVTEIAIHDRADKCDCLDFTMVATTVTAENTTICEDDGMRSFPAAPPGGKEEDMQSITGPNSPMYDANEPHLSPGAIQQSLPDPFSPLSIHSLTDSQLNNISLEMENQPIPEASCDLEDATELVCGLIKDLTFLNQTLMNAHRMIGLMQQGSRPPRPPFRRTHVP